MAQVLLKVHRSYRYIIAVCDANVAGRVLSEGIRTLDVSGNFFKGDSLSEEKAGAEIRRLVAEDATFMIVGRDSVALAQSIGIVTRGGVMEIEGVPFALVLL